ncbi:MAG TPA: hypothetical protein VGM39_15775 [Kofleriaceae bacterium]|jgi:hypothetical protein
MNRLFLLGVLASASTALATPSQKASHQLFVAIQKNDVATFKSFVESYPLLSFEVWFDDEACATSFTRAKVQEDEMPAYVACLSKLDLVEEGAGNWVSKDGLVVHVLMPSDKLRVINGSIQDGVPFVSLEVAEKHMTSGSFIVAPATPLPAGEHVAALGSACIAANGRVDSVKLTTSSNDAYRETVERATKKWKFKPFVRAGKKQPVCVTFVAGYPTARALDVADSIAVAPPPPPPPPDGAAASGSVPPRLLEGYRTGGEKVIVPDPETKAAIIKSDKERVIGSYKLCLDATGAITNVTTLKQTGFPAYDEKIISTMKSTWTYNGYVVDGKAVPVCTAVTFVYSTK